MCVFEFLSVCIRPTYDICIFYFLKKKNRRCILFNTTRLVVVWGDAILIIVHGSTMMLPAPLR